MESLAGNRLSAASPQLSVKIKKPLTAETPRAQKKQVECVIFRWSGFLSNLDEILIWFTDS
jgi:hypothetical protein